MLIPRPDPREFLFFFAERNLATVIHIFGKIFNDEKTGEKIKKQKHRVRSLQEGTLKTYATISRSESKKGVDIRQGINLGFLT